MAISEGCKMGPRIGPFNKEIIRKKKGNYQANLSLVREICVIGNLSAPKINISQHFMKIPIRMLDYLQHSAIFLGAKKPDRDCNTGYLDN